MNITLSKVQNVYKQWANGVCLAYSNIMHSCPHHNKLLPFKFKALQLELAWSSSDLARI